MSEALKMSYQQMLFHFDNATGSQESQSGATHCDEPDGKTPANVGPDRALASLSPRQAKEMGLLTSGTYGLRGSTLSSSADLASSLVSRYRAKTRCLGSTLFTLTWKVRYTPSRRPIFAVRASGLRTSDRDCTSWPTPTKQEAGRNLDENFKNVSNTSDTKFGVSLHQAAQLTTWPTPQAMDTRGDTRESSERTPEANAGGCSNLRETVQLTNWRSPSASDGEGGVMEIRPDTAGKYKPRDEAELVSWPTPCQQDGPNGGPNQGTDRLPGAADLAHWTSPNANEATETPDTKDARNKRHRDVGKAKGVGSYKLGTQAQLTASPWATPQTSDSGVSETARQGGENLSVMAQLTDSGEMPSGSIAGTGNGVLSGQLNPGHSRWLMSLPPIWDVCGIRAADAIRSRRSSKKAKAASPVSEATATP